MRPQTVSYLRRQLRLNEADLDDQLRVPPGTIAAAEAGTLSLSEPVIMRLRHIIKVAEMANAIPERQHIGMLIRHARVALGLSQQAIAQKIGMTQPTFAKLETAASPRISTLQRIAAAMGIPVDWILRGNVPLSRS
jgi:predicted transcriptional regulator